MMRRKSGNINRTGIRIKSLGWIVLLTGFFSTTAVAQCEAAVELGWMGGKEPAISTGLSWGVPFAEGQVQSDSEYLLEDAEGHSLPLQSWPMAFWPDGSLKWVGLSTVVETGSGSAFILRTAGEGARAKVSQEVMVRESEEAIHVHTGILECEIPRKGDHIFTSLKLEGREISSGAELVCILQDGPDTDWGVQSAREKFSGFTEKVSVEQSGPVRSVVKIEGRHVSDAGNREFLPFVVRLYFHAGQQSVKLVHTIIYDGDQHRDFIRGLGLAFDIPMDEEIYNRHIRFSGENGGFWSEPAQPLTGRKKLSPDTDYASMQIRGERIPGRVDFSDRQKFLVDNWAVWNDFRLFQGNADGFRIQKRTNDGSAWIDAGAGGRSSGLVFAGDVSGGLAVGVKDFWQSFPSALEVRDARTGSAQIRAWLWSPEGPAMDLRHYDTLAWGHSLKASYEDVQPGFSTPMGVGRTSEILLFATSGVPSAGTLGAISDQAARPALLTATPQYLHSTSVFGAWSLPDRSSRGKAWIEDQLDRAFNYYQLEVEQRNWYGYWDYGDVMHAYDPTRHCWRYDIGGFAWDNTELMPNMWLWYAYLRSGNPEVFTMAEAMTRHCGEVDVYHLGPFEGLGSRHNVRHWGCGAKEVRISQAALSRFYYYLTTDERTGDLMYEVVEASNKAIERVDPIRLIQKESQYPTHVRMGPDWLALVGNWMTAWERTGDDKYRDRIMTGVNSLSKMPYGLFSGKASAMGYDPATYKLYQLDKDDIGSSYLAVLMGGPEVVFELSHLLDSRKWDKLWLQFCRYISETPDNIEKEFGKRVKLEEPRPWSARLPAYYARETGQEAWAITAWDYFLEDRGTEGSNTLFFTSLVDKPGILAPVYEVKGVSTNRTAQWCLNAIEILELAGDQIPDDHPVFSIRDEKNKLKITLTNPSSVHLSDKAIAIERSRLGEIPVGEVFPLLISPNGDTVAMQLDDMDGDQSWDELFFVADLPVGESCSYTLEWVDKKPAYPVRTSVRFGKRMSEDIPLKPAGEEVLTAHEIPWALGFQRYQTDGPTWENDRVGFRHYLDGRNAKDVFGKKVPLISPEDVGINENGAVEDNYHVMEDWGRDILSVGNSVGLGGYGLLAGEKVLRLGIIAGDTLSNVEETSFKILTEGPVRSALNYRYSNWRPGEREYTVEENTSIWPGMYGYRNSVMMEGLQGDEELLVGLVNIHNDMPLEELEANDSYVVLYTHDKQTYDKGWWLGMALILPRDHYRGFMEAPDSGQLTDSYLGRLEIDNNTALSYYAVACWELSDEGFTDREYFSKYLQDLADQLAAEVEVTLE